MYDRIWIFGPQKVHILGFAPSQRSIFDISSLPRFQSRYAHAMLTLLNTYLIFTESCTTVEHDVSTWTKCGYDFRWFHWIQSIKGVYSYTVCDMCHVTLLKPLLITQSAAAPLPSPNACEALCSSTVQCSRMSDITVSVASTIDSLTACWS